MKKIEILHEKAMDLTEMALLEQRKNKKEKAKVLFRKVFLLEKEAATMMINQYDAEPTRSILFKSAACLAMDIEDYREAERMIAFALSGNPPIEITTELRALSLEILEKQNKNPKIEGTFLLKQIETLPNHLHQEAANFINYLVHKQTSLHQ